MAGRPQGFTKGQRDEIKAIIRNQLLVGTVTFITLLSGITGLSLWGIKVRLEKKLETLVAEQFKEPRVQQIVDAAAKAQASKLLNDQINPEVEKFKRDIAERVSAVSAAAGQIDQLKTATDINAAKIESALHSVQESQKQAEQITAELSGLHSDVVKVERGLVEIEYFTYKGRNIFPNPYHDKIMAKLNELLEIAVPDQQERGQFAKELEAYGQR
jgi:hypothetical protein